MTPSTPTVIPTEHRYDETLRVNALHALLYCPRLFYLEEVEELYTQDERVYAGRRLHAKLEQNYADNETIEAYTLESPKLGLRGKVDCLKTEKGQFIPYEHKRGRSLRKNGKATPWPSDRIQVLAYALLLEDCLQVEITEARIRYHAENVLVHVPVDEEGRKEVCQAIVQAYTLRQSTDRPPVIENEKLCATCALAPVCLPEESRLLERSEQKTRRFFPEDDSRQILHITSPEFKVGRSGHQVKITHVKGEQPDITVPINDIGQIVLHGFPQISTQTLAFCSEHDIGVHLISRGGKYIGSFQPGTSNVQRTIRQYKALTDSGFCTNLARKVVGCHAEHQRQVLMRYKRSGIKNADELQTITNQMAILIKSIPTVSELETLLGVEGNLAHLYFQALPLILSDTLDERMIPKGRNKRPPLDRFNALLSFGYSMLLKDVMNAIITVGLEPALGFYHQPRSQAAPLALDLMEIFRVLLVDIPVINSVNRHQWSPDEDFTIAGQQVWLNDDGRKKFIDLYEKRKKETWKHPVIGYSLSYSRLLELEVRLLEKEWTNEGGLFAQLRIR
ncbi:MAG: type I-MYXAN CRISPR-associated endonuclease Cas1 [Cyanobacteria bacterium]|nr:type I-MYXAN CRISPR-associated endonuclease Cas1 [Cyanobacteriota bacterium]